MVSDMFQMFAGALVAGLIGTGVWALQDAPRFDLAQAPHGLVLAER